MAETIVIGVVYPPGAAGGQFARDDTWTVRFTLQPWRIERGDRGEQPLHVSKVVMRDELERFMRELKAFQVVRLRVVLNADGAVLVGVVNAADSDAELRNAAAQLQLPETRLHPVFGVLTLNRDVDWWEADAVWRDHSVRLQLSPAEDGSIDGALRTADTLWNDQLAWSRRISSFAAEQLLALKNESWLADGEPALTSDIFEAKMSLQSVTTYDGGAFEFSHDDGDLFSGHSIEIAGDIESGPTDADIPG